MPDDTLILVGLLFFLAVAAGWMLGVRQARRNEGNDGNLLSTEYFRGLNYLLNEQPDRAIDVFIRMVEVDSATVETHFALGSLFRKRGEVDRAIRIHQNLIARPNLQRSHRNEALYALGEDYMRAGLLDRAESLFQELVDERSHTQQALHHLVAIYEQQKDWEEVIRTCRQLEAVIGESRGEVIAQYHCELAERELAKGDIRLARRQLKRAQQNDRHCVRALLLQARVAERDGSTRSAVRYLRRALELDVDLAAEILPKLAREFDRLGSRDGFTALLEDLRLQSEKATAHIALAGLLNPTISNRVTEECIARYLKISPGLRGLTELVEMLTGERLEDADRARTRLEGVVRRFLESGPRYQCRECGFTAKALMWQCPSCRNWNSIRPRFDIALPSMPALAETGGAATR